LTDEGPIYLDHQAHAPIDRRVAAVLSRAFIEFDANPHSSHLAGETARRAVEAARGTVASLIGAESAEVAFTSGATEANNLAFGGIHGRLAAARSSRVLVSAGEHPSVLAAASAFFDSVETIPLEATGTVDLEALERLLRGGAGLVSVAAANHEIGTVQPLGEISRLARAAGALLHSDLAQAAGKIPVVMGLLDLASISSHKLGGPVGIGAIAVRRTLRRHLSPLLHGGGQEGGLRPGSLPAPLCVAFGEACSLAAAEMADDALRLTRLRDGLLARLQLLGGVIVNGGPNRLAGNINLSFEGVDGEALVLRLRGEVAISTGSACTSTSLEPSHVLAAIGVTDRRAEGAVRISLGRQTTEAQVATAGNAIAAAVTALRATLRRVA
jgi:cysteine desulfurase